MASLSHLKPHLASLSVDEHEDGLNPSGALMELIGALNSLSSNPRAFTPSPIIVRGTDNSGWVYNEQQDAQEFFQKLTGALEKEVSRFLDRRKQGMRKGLEGIVGAKEEGEKIWQHLDLDTVLGKEYRSPFEGLFAQRVGCLRCGYVEAISLQPFTSLSLSLPSSVNLLPLIPRILLTHHSGPAPSKNAWTSSPPSKKSNKSSATNVLFSPSTNNS